MIPVSMVTAIYLIGGSVFEITGSVVLHLETGLCDCLTNSKSVCETYLKTNNFFTFSQISHFNNKLKKLYFTIF